MIKKAIVVCERSGIVRDALIEQGIDAISCDLAESEKPGNHIRANFRSLDYSRYDLVIAHPDCRYLSIAGIQYWKKNQVQQKKAVEDFMWLWNLPVEHICIENPVGYLSVVFRKPDQYIDPADFGHKEKKHTGLWLKNLPPLMSTYICPKKDRVEFVLSCSQNRRVNRARTFTGIAQAMAKQWACL